MNTPNRYSYLASLLVALCVTLTAGPIAAKTLLGSIQFRPYFGAEYQYQHIKSTTDWHDAYILPANFNNYAVFLGTKYHPNFGLEFGYYHYINRSQGQNIISSFEGQQASGDTLVIAQMRNKGFSVDWNVHYFLDPKFNIFALIGVVTYQPELVILTSEGTDLGNALRLVTAQNKAVLRLGAGAEYLEDWWGARARFMWDRTQGMELNVSDAQKIFGSISSDAFAQSFVVAVGLFYRF